MSEVQSMDVETARPFYERFFTHYPTAVRFMNFFIYHQQGRIWKQYVEAELAANNTEKAEEIFKRCLHTCLNVELWHTYLKYVRSKENKEQQPVGTSQAAYEHALENVGFDVSSNEIWLEYLEYLKNIKVSCTTHTNFVSQRINLTVTCE